MTHSIAWRSRSSSARSVDSLVAAFDEGWARPGGDLVGFWARSRGERPLGDLTALIKVDLRRRFALGERPAASTYLDQFPELAQDDDRVLSLVYEEFCLLDDHQAAPSVAEFCRRYERWQDSIASQLGYHRRFSQVATADRPEVAYPVVGDRFGSYQLRSLLGRGGSARVYLAADGDLGGREVVLKLTPTLGLEPSILASLEHRNIIPIHSVARPEGSVLQGICMPYRPGITLEELLVQLLGTGPPRRARIIWDLLDLDRLDRDQADLAWRDFPLNGTYTEGVAWLGLEMAQALAYLHGRGVYHRDVKPANILLSARGGPLLIDFNLAHSPHTPDQAQEAMTGGTLPYMAPEQLQAFLDPEAWPLVGPKADIYSLGLVLRELITGVRPALPDPSLPLDRAIGDLRDRRTDLASSARDLRPDLPPSLDAVVRKCLAFDPADRYASAQQLGVDLRLFLQRKPLAAATNPSKLECGWNWFYRQRWAALGPILLSVIFLFGILINLEFSRMRDDPRDPYDAPNDPIFQQSIELLRTSRPENLGEAEELLKGLADKHPGSAWPLVYLVQIEHQRSPRSPQLGFWLERIEGKPDAGTASLHCLNFVPRNWEIDKSRPNTTLGLLAASRGDLAKAREHYELALQQAHVGQSFIRLQLARLERSQGHRDRAIDYYLTSLNSLDPQSKHPHFFRDRYDLMRLLIEQLDRLLVANDLTRARATARLAELHQAALGREVAAHPERVKDFPYLPHLDRGRLASARGNLAALDARPERYREDFLEARRELDRAEALTKELPKAAKPPASVPSAEEVLVSIRAARNQLDDRIAASESSMQQSKSLPDFLGRP